MDSNSDAKSLQLPTFDGKYENFQLWWVRFMAFATICKFAQALRSGGENELIGQSENAIVDETTSSGKAVSAAMKRNAYAVASLTIAFTSEATMGLIWKAMTTDWPGGLAHLVVTCRCLRSISRKIPFQELSSDKC
jgi:hypothetical protein